MEIIVLIIIISFLAIILFIALKKLINTINDDSKEYYFKKIQELDSKIDEKNSSIPSNKENIKDEIENNSTQNVNYGLDQKLLDVINSSDYQNENPLQVAMKVDEIFQIDEEKVIKDFLANIKVNEDFETYQMLLDRFSPNLIYKLKMLDKDNQIKQITKMISDKEYVVFKSYIDSRKFKLDKFLLDLSMLIERNTPYIEIITGNKRKNYNYLSNYIKTVYSSDVYKGIIIKYQNQIFDYSINERDV